MNEKEPLYIKELREHIDHKIETHEPQYFKDFKNHVDKKFATKKDLKSMQLRFEQHTTDLTSGFKESLLGIGNYVKSIDEKVTNLDKRVVGIDNKLTNMQGDIFFIKESLKGFARKNDMLGLKRRVLKLEPR